MKYNKFKEFHWMARHQRVTKHAQQKDLQKKNKKYRERENKNKVYFFI